MTLRTPRRRISPRTKRRYRAIKDFLRRALGSSSQPDIKINSSIAINVSDLKHKIVGIEQQLSEVNKHCRDLVCLESSSRKDSETLVSAADRHELSSLKEQTEISSTKHGHGAETKLLYKTSESHYRKSDDSDSFGKVYHDSKGKDVKVADDMAAQGYYREPKIKKKKSKLDNRLNTKDDSNPNLRKRKTRSVYENFVSSYSTSYHSLIDPRSGQRKNSRDAERCYEEDYVEEYVQPVPVETKVRKHKDSIRRNNPDRAYYDHHEGRHRNKPKRNATRDLDQEFIADIIKRQYRPMKMFGHRESEISQFSAPVCRDQEFSLRENIQEGSELCSCCIDGHKKSRYENEHELNDMHSICDTRLYSSKRNTRHRHNRKHTDIYNDSTQYDIVPVKEKSSPKSRRKFTAESMTPYGYYKEVPPSPRTQRPRLNLKAQYFDEFEDYILYKKQRNCSLKRSKKNPDQSDHYVTNESSEVVDTHKGKQKCKSSKNHPNDNHIQQDAGTMSSLQSPIYNTEAINMTNDSAFNKTQETDSSTDKTDKALSEIKDILQCFLQEIKKETTVSQCDNSDITKTGDKCLNEFRQDSAKLNATMMPNSGHSVNNYSMPQCSIPSPFMPPFASPCCYPVLPVCPMNCVQNGYIMPSPSYTCASCTNNAKEDDFPKNSQSPKESANNIKNNETDELIKEIYKFVTQSPTSSRRKDIREKSGIEPAKTNDTKMLTSRSVGGSSKLSKHDAQVETRKIKCYSKSCEAIGSRFLSDTSYSRTNPSYSDTILERLSLEATATGSESEFSSESNTVKKPKKNRFAKVLRSFGLFKKKKDVIEELSESESTMEVEVNAKKPPFRQEVLNYMVHQQDYYNRPPQPSTHYPPPPEFPHSYGCHAGCPDHLNHVNPMQASYDHHYHAQELQHQREAAANYASKHHRPSAPPYPHPYEGHQHHTHNQPQVPLCLKEIEVKSIGTQSERKMTFFKKFSKKVQGPTYPVTQKHDQQRTGTTQTAKDSNKNNNRPPLFNWKNLQAKVNQLDNPPTFSYKTQKQLAEGDIKMRNAMLKKLFYKRNPFSPRNLIVRTLLGKDKSSYGEPPMMFRPRMFF
ncbi:uncharacterized protein LOC114351336 [Ostrinia furnacalis]|uniref:uncharacterized protein LOC114351336 n=1 Tax=Ostrinia furnacalis TaxID=93504 RepID=UPI00103A14D6|nr:uncharacterized protein LOC114351336 [Ostrinia furnacalis]